MGWGEGGGSGKTERKKKANEIADPAKFKKQRCVWWEFSKGKHNEGLIQ